MFDDPILIAKLVGAVVAFGLGIWIGLGRPGTGRPRRDMREWRSSDRLRATWINRVFFRMDRGPRRFEASRLIVPGEKRATPNGENEADGESTGSEIEDPAAR